MWRQLGEALFLVPYMDGISSSFQEEDKCLQALLYTWKQVPIKPYSWETLITALKSCKVGATHLVDALELKVKHHRECLQQSNISTTL